MPARHTMSAAVCVLSCAGLAAAAPSTDRLIPSGPSLWSVQGAADPIQNLTFAEKRKVREMLNLLEEMARKSECLDKTLDSIFNMDGDPGTDGDGDGNPDRVQYEPAGVTLKQAIQQLRNMLDQNRIQSRSDIGWGASTRPRRGTDADRIFISKELLKILCGDQAPPDMALEDDAERMMAKLQLTTSLANELVHVFQIFTGEDSKQCDAERDSDTASLKFICEIDDVIDALNNTAGVNGEDCPKLKACLMARGVDTNAEFSQVKTQTERMKNRYSNRRTNVFDANLLASNSWGRDYYGRDRYNWPLTFPGERLPQQIRLELPDGTLRFYVMPAGKTILNHTITRNAEGKVVLNILAQDAIGDLCLFTYVDTDCDGLPELTPAVTNIPVVSPFLRAFGEVTLRGVLPGDLEDAPTGFTIIDQLDGTITMGQIDPITGIPVGPPQILLQDPLIQNGFVFPGSTVDLGGQTGFGLSQVTPMEQDGSPPMLGIIFNPDLFTLDVAGLATDAELFPPPPMALEMFQGIPDVELVGPPFSPVELVEIGNGARIPLASDITDGTGLTPPIPVPPLPAGLFEVVDTGGFGLPGTIYFLPPLGQNIDCAELDLNFDGIPDRLQLSQDPPRLTMFFGLDPLLPQFQHMLELVLPLPLLEARGFDQVDPSLLVMQVQDQIGTVDIPLLPPPFPSGPPLPLPLPPVDLDGDGQADDALTIARLPTGDFQVDSFFDIEFSISFGPITPLPPIEPLTYELLDLNGDGIADIRIVDAFGGPDQCFINDGTGAFAPGDCGAPNCPADVNKDGLATPADFTAWLACFNDPGFAPFCANADVNADGSVSPADFTAWLAAFQAGCP